MKKMKLLTVILFILSAGRVVLAAEVINVDLNGYNDDRPYIGTGAYDVGESVWTVFYGGWGEPVGSARSEGLVTDEEEWYCSVYAAQVWIGDKGNHWYQWGSALMDDGFDVNEVAEPNISIFGEGAYQGIYDIYVYGSAAGSFKLTRYGNTTIKDVNGIYPPGEFVEGGNYVVFSDVDVNNANPADLYLTYTNKLNGLQLVREKSPVAIEPNEADVFRIQAGNYDVAGERNVRTDDPGGFGPDIFADPDPNIGLVVGYLEIPEFMTYDITVDDANQGQYDIRIGVDTGGSYPCYALDIYLDDRFLGTVTYNKVSPAIGDTTAVTTNLFEGDHTITWKFPPEGAVSTGFNIMYVKFTRTGDVVMNDCNDVTLYGLIYDADLTGNCVVDFQDLSVVVGNWLNCDNPDPDACP